MPEGWSYFLIHQDQKLELVEGRQVIGRSQSCDLTIPDPSISRQHATLEVATGVITVTDLGSSNGTFVNGQRITAPTHLRGGDRLGLGDAELETQIVPPSLETVRMPAAGFQAHGEATTFLQAASVQLAIETLGDDAEPLDTLEDPFADVPPEIFSGDPLAVENEDDTGDWEVPSELSGKIAVPPLVPPPPIPQLPPVVAVAPPPAPVLPPPPPPKPEGDELLPSLDALEHDLALPELPARKTEQPGLLGRLFGRRSK